MKEKKAVTRQVRSRCQKAGRKEKSAILDEFIRITAYKNRKYALRILNKPQAPQSLLVVKGTSRMSLPRIRTLPEPTSQNRARSGVWNRY